jgi:hypothetical protein
MGNSSEFKRAVGLIIDNVSFEKNNTVQVFEVTIRYVHINFDLNPTFLKFNLNVLIARYISCFLGSWVDF